MASIDYSATDELPQKSSGRVQPDMADLVGIARRGWFYMVAGTILGLLAAYAVLSNLSPVYKASSRIAFERTLPRYLQSNKITNEPLIDDYDTLGQTYVISSESILLPVVKALSLTTDPEFVGGKGSESLGSRIRGLFRTAAQAVGLQEETARRCRRSRPSRRSPVDASLRNLAVTREDVASVINDCIFVERPREGVSDRQRDRRHLPGGRHCRQSSNRPRLPARSCRSVSKN